MAAQQDSMKRAHEWYAEVVNDAIEDIPGPDGISQQCNLEVLVDKIADDVKSAQIMIQHCEQELKHGNKRNYELHGKWIAMAFLAAVGDSDEVQKFLQRVAPTLRRMAQDELDAM